MTEPRAMPAQSPKLMHDREPAHEHTVSFVALVNGLLRHRFLIFGLGLLFLVVTGVRGLLAPRTYTTTASFITQSSKAPGNLSGLAAQLGVNVPAADAATSPAFYLDLLKSRGVLGSVADSRFDYRADTGRVSATLDRILRVNGATAAAKREATIEALRNSISASMAQKTGVVTYGVRTRHPELSHLIATRISAEMTRFNLERRQSQAAAERKFAEGRLAEVRGELRIAEDRMQVFLQRNREYRSSPDLIFEAERLEREIALRQQLYAALSQSLEQAKMEEVRDTPVLTLIEQPNVPVGPDRRGLLRKGLLALGIGMLLGAMVAGARVVAGKARPESRDDVDEFEHLRRELVDDFRHPLRAVRRAFSSLRTPAEARKPSSA